MIIIIILIILITTITIIITVIIAIIVITIMIIITALGGAMACSNGYAIYKDLGFSPTYDQWSFLTVTRFLHSTIESQR